MFSKNISDIPDEILGLVFDYTYDDYFDDYRSIFALKIVSKRWERVIKNMSFRITLYSSCSYNYIKNIFNLKLEHIEIYVSEKMKKKNLDFLQKKLQMGKISKKVKCSTLEFGGDADPDIIKEILHTLDSVDRLNVYAIDIFESEDYNDSYFPENKCLKYLSLADTQINNYELGKLFEKFPKLEILDIENCTILDKISHENLLRLNILYLTVEDHDDLCFSVKDVKYIKENYPNIEKLYVNGEIY
jgi:hypothetical protein